MESWNLKDVNCWSVRAMREQTKMVLLYMEAPVRAHHSILLLEWEKENAEAWIWLQVADKSLQSAESVAEQSRD
jgi:hypothetical protein